MQRRSFLLGGLAVVGAQQLHAAVQREEFGAACEILATAVASRQVTAATLFVSHRKEAFAKAFGTAKSADAMFLLGSISKPIAVMALLTLFDQQKLKLEDPVQKYLPRFTGDGRERVSIRHLLTHVSGLPDQLANNDALRKQHAGLDEFVAEAQRAPLSFAPGTKYQYSSMGILLASRIAELLSGQPIDKLIDATVFKPLKMKHASQGVGNFALEDLVPVQTDRAAPESGGGDPAAKDWDWNSRYWRALGAPWGGTHASAPDVGRFLAELLYEQEAVLKPTTARMMITNQNREGLSPRGLGLNVGVGAGSPGCSERTFGHTGSTGTICWADPGTQTICVVLTSLPGRAAQSHPRDLAAASVAEVITHHQRK